MAPSIQYEKKHKILSIRLSKQKSVDSDISGNIVIDYDKKGEIVNIDIMDINLDTCVTATEKAQLSIR